MRSLLITCVGLLLLAIPSVAGAQDCDMVEDLAEAVRRADSVFVARITEVSDQGINAEAEVLSVWKGPDLPEVVSLRGGPDPTSIGPTTRVHTEGETYLVVTSWSRRAFVDDECTATRLYSGSPTRIPGQLADAVGADEAREPLPSAPSATPTATRSPSYGIAVVGLLLVLVVVGTFLVRRAVSYQARVKPAEYMGMLNDKNTRGRLAQPSGRMGGWLGGLVLRSGKDKVKQLKSGR